MGGHARRARARLGRRAGRRTPPGALGAARGRVRRAGRGPARRQHGAGRRRAVELGGARVLGRRRRCSTSLGVELTDDAADATSCAPRIRAETEVVGAPTGGMDQTVAMLGVRRAPRCSSTSTPHEPTAVPLDLAGHTLLVTDTRVSHALTDGGYGSRRADCESGGRGARRADPARRRPSRRSRRSTDERVRRRATHVVTEIERVTDTVDGARGRRLGRGRAALRRLAPLDARRLRDLLPRARLRGGGRGPGRRGRGPDDRRRLRRVQRRRGARRAGRGGRCEPIDAAFVLEGFRAPVHLRAVPVGRCASSSTVESRYSARLGYADRCDRPRDGRESSRHDELNPNSSPQHRRLLRPGRHLLRHRPLRDALRDPLPARRPVGPGLPRTRAPCT